MHVDPWHNISSVTLIKDGLLWSIVSAVNTRTFPLEVERLF